MNEIVPIVLAAVALAAVLAALWSLAGVKRERERADRLTGELRLAQDRAIRAEANAEAAERSKSEVGDAFRAMSADALEKAGETLSRRAESFFEVRDQAAKAQIEAQLKPVSETLAEFKSKVDLLEAARAEQHGGLKLQLEQLATATQLTQTEARRLTDALKRGPGVRGRWGEQTLRNVLEAAGMTGRYDFQEQTSYEGEGGKLRPDVVVSLPGGGAFVIDSKVSLNAYLDAHESADDTLRETLMGQHADSVRRHAADLSGKAYWSALEKAGVRSPDFVAMFIPGDSFLCAALDRVPELMTDALANRVLIVTPTTLFALCKAVAYGWRAERQAENAAKVAELGKTLYERLSVMGGHVAGMGKALGAATERYNAFVGSLESQVMTQARRFEELKVEHQGRSLPELPPVETAVRSLTKLSAATDEAA